jgi:phosphonate transport system ATP-binding protein
MQDSSINKDCRSQDSLLRISGLGKVYPGGTRALDNINLDIAAGEFISVIGLSGSGKSTLIRCINRMIDPSEGSISFMDEEVCALRGSKLRQLRTHIGMIFQHYNLVPRLTVIENVLHGRLGYKSTLKGALGWYTGAERDEALRILEELDLGDQLHKRCDQLSGGQKQRVGIARALIQEPRLILGDEPVASLDPNSSKTIMDTLRHINRERNITCILNLHQLEFAEEYSDRILGIRAGEIVFDGPPADFDAAARETVYGRMEASKGEDEGFVAAS